MEAKDTVMSKGLQKSYEIDLPQHISGIEWQAEISFKAGQKDMLGKLIEANKRDDKLTNFGFGLSQSEFEGLHGLQILCNQLFQSGINKAKNEQVKTIREAIEYFTAGHRELETDTVEVTEDDIKKWLDGIITNNMKEFWQSCKDYMSSEEAEREFKEQGLKLARDAMMAKAIKQYECFGALTCGITKCDHFLPHERRPGCENGCFGTSGCTEVKEK